MFGIADYGAFVAAILLFLAIPGPGNLALVTSTGKGGVRAGMAATLGVIAGDQVLLWMAVAGVAAMLSAVPAVFHAVQWLGAAYLAWMGARMLLARPGPVRHRSSPSSPGTTSARPRSSRCSTPRPSCSTWRSFRYSSIRPATAAC